MEKEELRKKMLLIRDEISENDRILWSGEVMLRLFSLSSFCEAEVILSYASFRSEVQTDVLNQRLLELGKALYLPKTDPSTKALTFYPVRNLAELIDGYQGIREPRELGKPFEQFDRGEKKVWMLMPGVAFDPDGNRIGYGGGCYDRYLEKYSKKIDVTCMLAYDRQRTERIPTEDCDIRPDQIVTNAGKWRER